MLLKCYKITTQYLVSLPMKASGETDQYLPRHATGNENVNQFLESLHFRISAEGSNESSNVPFGFVMTINKLITIIVVANLYNSLQEKLVKSALDLTTQNHNSTLWFLDACMSGEQKAAKVVGC